VQLPKVSGCAEVGLVLVVLQQAHAEVIVAHVRGEVITDNAWQALVGFSIDNMGFQYFNQRNGMAATLIIDVHFNGNDVKFDRITIAFWVIPVGQGVETVVNHP
jgi:hypothetical protein